jgi:hypothetical protein
MAKSKDTAPEYVIDCEGLAEISTTSNNAARSIVIDLLDKSVMIVPTAVSDELKEAFEGAAVDLAPHINKSKMRLTPKHRMAAGTLASRQNSGFHIEPYGDSDLIAGAVATCENCTLVTTIQKKAFYIKMLSCHVISIDELPATSP